VSSRRRKVQRRKRWTFGARGSSGIVQYGTQTKAVCVVKKSEAPLLIWRGVGGEWAERFRRRASHKRALPRTSEVHSQPTGPRIESEGASMLTNAREAEITDRARRTFASFGSQIPYCLSRFFFTSSALRATRFHTAESPMALVAIESVARASSRIFIVPS
jgi:hypothetical protein